jgi:hypothetical protein
LKVAQEFILQLSLLYVFVTYKYFFENLNVFFWILALKCELHVVEIEGFENGILACENFNDSIMMEQIVGEELRQCISPGIKLILLLTIGDSELFDWKDVFWRHYE